MQIEVRKEEQARRAEESNKQFELQLEKLRQRAERPTGDTQ